ncbi:HAMP domain-containing sensor histidine kinase [Streptomyces zagrosensis]|uniref:histidine kinase n=1 Tax=Streptomyces zagrosensis TaxID=1042984 RepID=A0A7W9QEF7_9ACTN|nr:HAMP domain-containing sensor histidine kinase [Streptomyces zagrosensis]MBB5938735.1 signal transduction histidine kinase [Streptomyces zagrosensis]
MKHLGNSLRVRLALFGFLAIYVPALLLFGVVLATATETTHVSSTGARAKETTTVHRSKTALWTIIALGPAAAGLAWWWAGRAVRPIDHVRTVADDIRSADLSRRIALRRGPTEVVTLAASFDGMLDRLEQAAELQRRLIEETSHELRLPLAVLVTNAEVLLAHPEPTVEVYRQGLERSRSAAVRLQAVMNELLVDARGRARTIDRRATDLAAVAHAVVEEVAVPAAAKGIQLLATGAPAAVCLVDEPTVHRAIRNLVDNAVRYAPRDTAVEVAVQVSDAQAAVVVSDEGPGIPADDQARVFQRFWRGQAEPHGTGLGLAIAHQVAVAHGGALTLTSPGPSGSGCTFRFTVHR